MQNKRSPRPKRSSDALLIRYASVKNLYTKCLYLLHVKRKTVEQIVQYIVCDVINKRSSFILQECAYF